jgi:arsenite methyltransferase
MTADSIHQEVRTRYAAAASLATAGACCSGESETIGGGLYSALEQAELPEAAVLASLGCGNPIAVADLHDGERVLDLGSGGGIDVLLSAKRVGPTGRAIGLDMTDEMLALAQRNAADAGATNVEFLKGQIEAIPLPAGSVDVVISNCVINLAVDKPAVFREIARVVKPGGRLAVSDIALKQPLPAEIGNDLLAYVGCIAGAILIDDYRQGLLDAGFAHVEIVDTGSDLNVYAKIDSQVVCCAPEPDSSKALPVAASGCCSPASQSAEETFGLRRLAEMLSRYNVNDYAASVRVYAVKPVE